MLKTIYHQLQGAAILLFCILYGFSSCTELIDIKTDNSEPVIVIIGCVTDTLAHQQVRVSTSSPYFDNQPNAGLSGADVVITSSLNETFELEENDTIAGTYQTIDAMSGVPGVTYTLNVKYDFDKDGIKETYTATTQMPTPVVVDSIQVLPLRTMGRDLFSVNLYAQDSPERDYYMCKYLVNDSLITTKISLYQVFDDNSLNGVYIKGMVLTFFSNISEIDSYTEDEKKDRTFIEYGDTIELQMSKIERGYYDFLMQCQKEMRGENPFFGGPASNIYTNISNGGIGCFSAFGISRAKAITP